jgi:hypothetical protein
VKQSLELINFNSDTVTSLIFNDLGGIIAHFAQEEPALTIISSPTPISRKLRAFPSLNAISR